METLNIVHNSPEWLTFRKTGIGGSDAAAVLGLSPFKSNVDVWEEKVGIREPEDISNKPSVKYGKEAEELHLALFKLDYPEYEVTSHKDIVYKLDFMFASLDGELVDKRTKEEGIYEGKTTEIHSKSSYEKWNARIPDYYYAQILHYLIVTNKKFVKLRAQIKQTGQNGEVECIIKHYHFSRKECLSDMRYLYLEEKKFWEYVKSKTKPPLKLPGI